MKTDFPMCATSMRDCSVGLKLLEAITIHLQADESSLPQLEQFRLLALKGNSAYNLQVAQVEQLTGIYRSNVKAATTGCLQSSFRIWSSVQFITGTIVLT